MELDLYERLVHGFILLNYGEANSDIYFTMDKVIQCAGNLILVFHKDLSRSIAMLITGCMSNDHTTKIKCCDWITILLGSRMVPTSFIDQVINTGITSEIVKFLQCTENEELQISSVYAVKAIVSCRKQNYSIVRSMNGIQILIDLIKKPKYCRLHNVIIAALSTISYYGDVILDGGILINLLRVCENWYGKAMKLVFVIAPFLYNICNQRLKRQHIPLIIKCLGYLFNSISYMNGVRQERMIFHVGGATLDLIDRIRLAQQKEIELFLEQLNENGIIQKLVHLSNHGNKIRITMLRPIWQILLLWNRKYTHKIIKYGLFQRYYNLLRIIKNVQNVDDIVTVLFDDYTFYQIFQKICKSIYYISRFNEPKCIIKYIAKSQIFVILIEMIMNSEQKIAEEAVIMFENILISGLGNGCKHRNYFVGLDLVPSFSLFTKRTLRNTRALIAAFHVVSFMHLFNIKDTNDLLLLIEDHDGVNLFELINLNDSNLLDMLQVLSSICLWFGEYSIALKLIKFGCSTFKNQGDSTKSQIYRYQKKQQEIIKHLQLLNCSYCGRQNENIKPLKACTGCMKELYCSRYCQKKHWIIKHRTICNHSWEEKYKNLKSALFHR